MTDSTMQVPYQDFSYRGRPLSYWLAELVCDDPGRREIADDVIRNRFISPFRVLQELPESERPDFGLELWNAWERNFDNAVLDVFHGESLSSYGLSTSDFLRGILEKTCESKNHLQKLLAKEFLQIFDVIRQRAKDGQLSSTLHFVIRHFGAEGDLLFEDMFNRYGFDSDRELPKTVGILARSRSEHVERIIDTLSGSDSLHARFALQALGYCGPVAERLCPGTEFRLHDLFHAGVESFEKQFRVDPFQARCEYYDPLISLARVGANTKTAEILLEFSRYKPPQLDNRYDNDSLEWSNYTLSHWIDAMAEFARFPEIIAGRLAEMFEEFEEYDPDYRDHPRYHRILDAVVAYAVADSNAEPFLEKPPRLFEHWNMPKFPGADNPALLPLIHTLGNYIDDEGEPDNVILNILSRFGSAASCQLPNLYEIKKQRESVTPFDDDVVVISAIRRIETDCSETTGLQ